MTLKEYLTSEDTESALRFTVGSSLPLLVGAALGYQQVGLFMFLGGLFVFGIDIPIALPKKMAFMVAAGLLSALLFIVFTQVKDLPVLNALLLFVVLFVLNFLSPFTPNFSIVALLLNLSVMIGLSMAASVPTFADALQRAGWLLLGSGWYTLYALLLHPLLRPRQLRRRLEECLRLTADYFAQQAELLDAAKPGEEVLLALTEKQANIVSLHQQMREALLREPINVTNPETFMGQATYFLASLVDLLELATASVPSLQTLPDGPEKARALPLLARLNVSIMAQLRQLADHLDDDQPPAPAYDAEAEKDLQRLTEYLDGLKLDLPGHAQTADAYRPLRRIQRNVETELGLLRNLWNILARHEVPQDVLVDNVRRFAIRETIGWDYLRSHLSMQSGFFRYALRMSLTAVVAYYLAVALGLGNPSWALLTVLVILKPGFSLSRQRLAMRTYGTVAGVAVGLVLFYVFRPGPLASLAIFVGSQFFAFSFLKRQYAVTTGFFTLFILFFYSYLQRGFMDTAYYRLLDTLLAAGLCWLATRFLFPFWELQNLPRNVQEAIRANRNLLNSVLEQVKGAPPTGGDYKLFRKEAFLKTDGLLNSYRLAQVETPGRTEALSGIQRVALLIYTQLSLIVNLGLFLQRNPSYRTHDGEVERQLAQALSSLDALIGSGTYLAEPAEAEETGNTALAKRQREAEALLRHSADEYQTKAYDLFWFENALKITAVTNRLQQKLKMIDVAT